MMIAKHATTQVLQHMEFSGIGPVTAAFEVPIPACGGVVEALGEQAVGKSTFLRAVRKWLGAKDDVSPNDTIGRGFLRFEGSEARFGGKLTRKGAAPSDVALFLEDVGDLDDFVDPPEDGSTDAGRVRRDMRRIKWLLRMSGATVDFSEFEAIIPPHDGYDPITIAEFRKEPDVVDQAGKICRKFQEEARRVESLAKSERQEQAVLEGAVEGVDVSAPCDAAVLQAAHTAAVAAFAALDERRLAADKASEARRTAGERLAAVKGSYTGPTVSSATQVVEAARTVSAAAEAKVREIEQSLRDAKHAAALAIVECRASEGQLKAALEHDRAVAEMTGMLEGQLPDPPDQDDIAAAKCDMEDAASAMEAAVLVRDANAKAAKAKMHKTIAERHEAYALKLRDAATATEAVLSAAVKVDGLKVLGGRLMFYGKTTDGEPFDRLSDGERWKVGIQIAAMRVSEQDGDGTRLTTLKQGAWGELSPSSRKWVDQCAREYGVVLLTARAANGPLRFVVFGDNDEYES